ncbi:MAG: phospho-sugar glycosidase domain-containing protein, partial [Cetobacterium sp.]
IRTAAFISTSHGEIGPWSINDGLCTLEEHRNLSITTAAKHLWATGLIDDVIVGNAYATEDELRKLGELNRYLVELDIYLEKNISDVEKSIINELHVRRGDINDYMIRSTEVRKKHINSEILVLDEIEQKLGDIMIGNNSFGKYKGELQVILKDIPKDGRKNKVASVDEEELFLLNYVGAWSKFKLKVRN